MPELATETYTFVGTGSLDAGGFLSVKTQGAYIRPQPAPTAMDFPTLQLTYTVKKSGMAGIYIGRINEIGGIFAQADSPEQVRADLIRNAYTMLRNYKQREMMDLLVKQQKARLEDLYAGPTPDFRLELQQQELERVQAADVA